MSSQGLTRPLVSRRARPVAIAIMGVAFLVLIPLSVWLHDTRDPTGFDNAVRGWLFRHFGTTAQRTLLGLSEPVLAIGIVVGVAVIAALRRRWEVAAVAVVGPGVAVVMSTVILKPIVNRLFGQAAVLSHGVLPAGYAFPSGHETGLTAATTLLALLLLRAPVPRPAKIVGVLVAVVWTVAGAAGLVRSNYHYALDTVGGACVSMIVVIGTALVVDAALPDRLRWVRGGVS